MATNLKFIKENDQILKELRMRRENLSYLLPDGKPGLLAVSEDAEVIVFLVSSHSMTIKNVDTDQYQSIYIIIYSIPLARALTYKFYETADDSDSKQELKALSSKMKSYFKRFLNSLPNSFTMNQAKAVLDKSNEIMASGKIEV